MNDLRIKELQDKITELSKRQELFGKEIAKLSEEIRLLSNDVQSVENEVITETVVIQEKIQVTENQSIKKSEEDFSLEDFLPKKRRKTSDLEKIIGESWINKVGILILIFGVFLGGKYSIENNLINPLTRIVLGYLSGVALFAFGMKLKAKFEAYSAVLVSGAITIFYFITFFAYDFYGLIPQVLAFLLMVLFTVFAVLASLHYDKPVIAHIGLVGAYAVPFLLSSGSNRADIMFAYMAIINIGILVISIKKHWKSIHYASFGFTWLIFLIWLISKYEAQYQQMLALIFAFVFFAQFYAMAIVNRIISGQKMAVSDIFIWLLNSVLFFLIGIYILDNQEVTSGYLGVFTLFNAVINFAVAYFIHKRNLADKTLLYMVIGLVFAFITIAIPIQLNGNWVTLMWGVMAAVLFWVGKTRQLLVYERFALVSASLSFISLLEDWTASTGANAFMNSLFLTNILISICYCFILYLSFRKHLSTENQIVTLVSVFLGVTLYGAFFIEIQNAFNQWFGSSSFTAYDKDLEMEIDYYNYAIHYVKMVVLIAYSIVFFAAMSVLNMLKIRSKMLTLVSVAFLLFSLLISQTLGYYALGELLGEYIYRAENQYFSIGLGYILVRYVLFFAIALGVISLLKYAQQEYLKTHVSILKFISEFSLYVLILSVLTNELVTWLSVAGYQNSFKLGVSLLWGFYAFVLIYFGIFKRKKHLRIGAIVLFAITLLKLFLYDISHLNTLSKIIVFICLGVLLLVISFLYNKFKDRILDDENIL